MEVDWFWLTAIVLIISICVYNTLDSYFEHKYGSRKKDEQ